MAGSASVHAGIPPGADPPGADPPEQTPWSRPPRSRYPRSRHPTGAEHAGRYGQRAGGKHSAGLQSCKYFECFEQYRKTFLYGSQLIRKLQLIFNKQNYTVFYTLLTTRPQPPALKD